MLLGLSSKFDKRWLHHVLNSLECAFCHIGGMTRPIGNVPLPSHQFFEDGYNVLPIVNTVKYRMQYFSCFGTNWCCSQWAESLWSYFRDVHRTFALKRVRVPKLWFVPEFWFSGESVIVLDGKFLSNNNSAQYPVVKPRGTPDYISNIKYMS